MNCPRCSKTIEERMQSEKLCEACFLDLIERRAQKTLQHRNLTRGDRVLILYDETKEAAVTDYLFKKIMRSVPLSIDVKRKEQVTPETMTKDYRAVVLPWDMDDEAEALITAMVNNLPLENKNAIKLLENIYDREVQLFADIKKFTYKDQEKSKVQRALETIEARYPNSSFAVINSIKLMQQKKPQQ